MQEIMCFSMKMMKKMYFLLIIFGDVLEEQCAR